VPDPEEVSRLLRDAATLGDALDALSDTALWSGAPSGELARRQRRWAFESAALDLALRQAGRSLAQVLDRTARPVRFVASFRLGEPPSFEPVAERLRAYPELRLKLDPTSDWSEELFREVAGTGAVHVVDLKGAYRGTMVDQPPDAALYRRVVEAFPDALLEDPGLTGETRPVLEPHARRVSWDAPVLGVAELERLPMAPAAVNVKPSRIGALEEVLALYEHCERAGIPVYGGGMFELGVGRRQLQALAAAFHPDAPNDVAPAEYHDPRPDRLPRSPLPPPEGVGFG
jgi:L-alanine-DL-glutamate epimerase-like enolase superfamily enzyme